MKTPKESQKAMEDKDNSIYELIEIPKSNFNYDDETKDQNHLAKKNIRSDGKCDDKRKEHDYGLETTRNDISVDNVVESYQDKNKNPSNTKNSSNPPGSHERQSKPSLFNQLIPKRVEIPQIKIQDNFEAFKQNFEEIKKNFENSRTTTPN